MITAILSALFVSSALVAGAVLADAFRKARHLHGELRRALAASHDYRDVRIRHVDLKVHAFVAQLPVARIGTRQNGQRNFPELALAA
ncbi:MAG: hypothetical protein WCY92_01500 [Novosphingobium sp.]